MYSGGEGLLMLIFIISKGEKNEEGTLKEKAAQQ